MKSFRFGFTVSVFMFITSTAFSQFSFSYYASTFSKFGLGYNFSSNFWSECRIYGNHELEDTNCELVACYDLTKKERHSVYMGLGLSVNVLNSVMVPFGVKFNPVENFDQFSLQMELMPAYELDNGLYLLTALGLRYKFGSN